MSSSLRTATLDMPKLVAWGKTNGGCHGYTDYRLLSGLNAEFLLRVWSPPQKGSSYSGVWITYSAENIPHEDRVGLIRCIGTHLVHGDGVRFHHAVLDFIRKIVNLNDTVYYGEAPYDLTFSVKVGSEKGGE